MGLIANNIARDLTNTLGHTSSVTEKLSQRYMEFFIPQFSTVHQIGDRQKVQGSEINRDDELTQYLGSSKGIIITFYYFILILY
jgi:hypothetical protein